MDEKEKNATSLEYVKAAHIVATCPKSRLPMVLEILRQGGIEIQPESEDEAYEFTEDARRNWLKEKRETEGGEKNGNPDDEVWVLLKRAYDEGISLIKLGNKVGLHKTTVYHYLRGDRPITYKREALAAAIKEMLGIPDPPPRQDIPFWEDGEEELPKKSTRSRK